MKFPIVIKDGNDLITFTGENKRSGTNPEAHYQNGAVVHSSLADMMLRVESGKAFIVISAESPIVVVRVPGTERIYRHREGNVEISINEGRHWMSTNHSLASFTLSLIDYGASYAPLGEFIG
jgi:predicted neuraminidase